MPAALPAGESYTDFIRGLRARRSVVLLRKSRHFYARRHLRIGLCLTTALFLGLGVTSAARAQATTQAQPQNLVVSPVRPKSPLLQGLPQFNALPETTHNPTRNQAPSAIHTGDWGVFNRDGGSPAGFGPVSRYGTIRASEDWSYLLDPAVSPASSPASSNDIFDPLKFIPLNQSKSVYLTLSLDERLKNWFETRPFLGTQAPSDSGRMTVRGIYGADLHLGPYFRVYGELVNGDGGGWAAYGYNATYRTRLDVQQLFAELRLPLLGAKTGLMFGRQEFLDAPNYVLYARETPNVPLSWNGVRGYAVWPRIRVDLFDFTQTNNTPPRLFGDTENYNARLFGAYESWAPPDFNFFHAPGHVFLDFFYLGYEFGGTAAAIATAKSTAAGSTLRDNYGTRFWGKAGPIEFSLGGIYQGGEFRYAKSTRTRDVGAYSINTLVGYRLAGVFSQPLIALQSDLYSGGNANKTTGSEGTYVAPYNPATNYLDTTTYLTASNLIDTGPVVELSPTLATLIRVKVPFFWRDSTNDAVYGTNRIYAYRGNFSGGYVGTTPQATVAFRINRHLSWTNDIARFFASRQLSKAGASDGTYYLSTIQFRF